MLRSLDKYLKVFARLYALRLPFRTLEVRLGASASKNAARYDCKRSTLRLQTQHVTIADATR